jgi:hypothetical protein
MSVLVGRRGLARALAAALFVVTSDGQTTHAQPVKPPSSRYIVKVAQNKSGDVQLHTLAQSLERELGENVVFESDNYFRDEKCEGEVPCDVVTIEGPARDDDRLYTIMVKDGSAKVRLHTTLFSPWTCDASWRRDQCVGAVQVTRVGSLKDHVLDCHKRHETDRCRSLP